jgi:hypothetical protein
MKSSNVSDATPRTHSKSYASCPYTRTSQAFTQTSSLLRLPSASNTLKSILDVLFDLSNTESTNTIRSPLSKKTLRRNTISSATQLQQTPPNSLDISISLAVITIDGRLENDTKRHHRLLCCIAETFFSI